MNHKPPSLKHQSSRFILRVSLVPYMGSEDRWMGGISLPYPCTVGYLSQDCRLVATHLATASQCQPACVSWHSALYHPGLLPFWQTHRGRALVTPQGAEHGFGLLSGQIKQPLKLRAQFELTNEHLKMPYPSPSCLCQPPWPSSPSLFLSESSPREVDAS